MAGIPDALHNAADIFAAMRAALIAAERELRAIGRTPETLEAVQTALALTDPPPERPPCPTCGSTRHVITWRSMRNPLLVATKPCPDCCPDSEEP